MTNWGEKHTRGRPVRPRYISMLSPAAATGDSDATAVEAEEEVCGVCEEQDEGILGDADVTAQTPKRVD